MATRTPFFTEPTTATWGIPFPAVSTTVTDEVSAATSYGVLLAVSQEWLKHSGEPGVRVLGSLLTLVLSTAGNAFLLDAEAASDTRPAGLSAGVDLTVTRAYRDD